MVNGFYQLASRHGYILATSKDYVWGLASDSAWRIPVVHGSSSSSGRLYIPDSAAKPSVITWWTLHMELMVSTFIFHSSPIPHTLLLGWFGNNPHVTYRSFCSAFCCHSSYFSHLGPAFLPAAKLIFTELYGFLCLDSRMVQSIGPTSIPICHPACSSSLSTLAAQYLPLQVAMISGGPFAFVQEVDAALRTARRKIFNVPFYGVYLLQPTPFSPAFLSSFLTLQTFISCHLNIVNQPLAPGSLSRLDFSGRISSISTSIALYTHDPHSLHGCPFRFYPTHCTHLPCSYNLRCPISRLFHHSCSARSRPFGELYRSQWF